VMPGTVMEVSSYRIERFGHHESGAVLLFVVCFGMRGQCVLYGVELNGKLVKAMFLRTLWDICYRKFPGSFIFRFYRSFEVLIGAAREEKCTPTLLVLFSVISTFFFFFLSKILVSNNICCLLKKKSKTDKQL
jgi:hypothetical protein